MRNVFIILFINLVISLLSINFVFAQAENILLVPDDLQQQIMELSSDWDANIEYPEVVDGYQKIVLQGNDCFASLSERDFILYAPVSIGADYSGFQVLVKTKASVALILEKDEESIDYELIKLTDDGTTIVKEDGNLWWITGNDDVTILQLILKNGRIFQDGVYDLKILYTIQHCKHPYRLPVRIDEDLPDNWPEYCGYNAWISFDDLSYNPVDESFRVPFRAGFLEDMTINIYEFYKSRNYNITRYNIQGRSDVDNVECFYELDNPDNVTLDYSNNLLQISRENPWLSMHLEPDEDGIFEGELLLNIGGPNSGRCLSSALEGFKELSIGISCEKSSNICCYEKDFDITDHLIDLPSTTSFNGCQDFKEGTLEYEQCLNCLFRGGDSNGEVTGSIWTEIGCIDPSPAGIITRIFQIGLGLMGGVAVLRIIQIAYLYQQSDPQKVEEASSLLTSLIAGLILMILGVVILQFLGISVLGLPKGFLGG